MSASLREIHHWIYNKIVLAEKVEQAMVQWATSQGLPVKEWMEENIKKYGKPAGEKPLKKIIDPSNTHGWLQDRIKSVELRQAALITEILKNNPEYKKNLAEIFAKQGEIAAREYKGALPGNPEEVYITLNDFLLDGMPNERVNEILDGNENLMIWRTVTCLHKPYWDEVGGDISHYYDLREAWVKAFVETLTPQLTYEKRPNGNHKIVRK